MRIEATRKVVARYDLPDEVSTAAPLPYYRGAVFLPVHVTEVLEEGGAGGPKYTVKVRGPVLTSKGNRHATWTGEASWRSHSYFQGTPTAELAHVPPAIAERLLGADRLADEALTGRPAVGAKHAVIPSEVPEVAAT